LVALLVLLECAMGFAPRAAQGANLTADAPWSLQLQSGSTPGESGVREIAGELARDWRWVAGRWGFLLSPSVRWVGYLTQPDHFAGPSQALEPQLRWGVDREGYRMRGGAWYSQPLTTSGEMSHGLYSQSLFRLMQWQGGTLQLGPFASNSSLLGYRLGVATELQQQWLVAQTLHGPRLRLKGRTELEQETFPLDGKSWHLMRNRDLLLESSYRVERGSADGHWSVEAESGFTIDFGDALMGRRIDRASLTWGSDFESEQGPWARANFARRW
jgi:hypothetical protein